MADDCLPYCGEPLVFPRRPVNRPGLSRIGYRIGAYPEFRDAMLRLINAAVPLRTWTHRGADDPAMALLEGAAVVGDILTFYQEHYANEVYLRTASWRESVAQLVRLLGYRLAPGLAGRAIFAFAIKGDKALTIPAGCPIKAELVEVSEPASFQTETELIAYPHLSHFHLYRPRQYVASIPAGVNQLELASVEGQSDPESLAAADVKKGDRLVLMSSAVTWSVDGAAFSSQQTPQIITVSKVTQIVGRFLIEFEGQLQESWTGPVAAYRVGRIFRHFGHQAPDTYTVSKKHGNEVTGALEFSTSYQRHLSPNHDCTAHDIQRHGSPLVLRPDLFALDQEVTQLSLGSRFLIETRVQFTGQPGNEREPLWVVRRITGLTSAALTCAGLSGTSTLVQVNQEIILNRTRVSNPEADLRDFRFFEITSPKLGLQGLAQFPLTGPFTTGTDALGFFGTQAQAQALAGRSLWFQHEDGRSAARVCTNTELAAPAGTADFPQIWRLSFDQALSPFIGDDFDEFEPRVTVYGNLIEATQGKAEPDAVLGNGDNRLPFQTFKLPKSPLTYLARTGATPPEAPELEIRVNGRLWTRVDSLFGHEPKEEIYIVREDAGGTSYVQFGDGETGARLPSGLQNVTARYRSGAGAFGPGKPGAYPTSSLRIDGLDKIYLPGLVSGGSAAESPDKAREAAPGKIQSLGRLVSLRDYETEVLSLAGVTTVTAAWGLHNHAPTVLLRVLLEAGREAEFNAVRDQIALAQICRGPDRYPVAVEQAGFRYVFLDLQYAYDPVLLTVEVEAAIRAALGLAGDEAQARAGLFGRRRRRLGDKEYASRIEGVIQNVPGVRWCRVTALGHFKANIDPETTPRPASPRPRLPQVKCPANRMLQLHPNHLALFAVANPEVDPCL